MDLKEVRCKDLDWIHFVSIMKSREHCTNEPLGSIKDRNVLTPDRSGLVYEVK